MKQEYVWEALFGRVVCFSLNKAVTAWAAENNLLIAYNVPRNKAVYYYAQAHNGIVLSHSDVHHLRRSVNLPAFDDYCLAAKRHHTRLTIAKWSNIWYNNPGSRSHSMSRTTNRHQARHRKDLQAEEGGLYRATWTCGDQSRTHLRTNGSRRAYLGINGC